LLEVDEAHIGREGQCKQCGAKFILSRPTDSEQASPPAIPLRQDAPSSEVRTSGLAITSFVLGILSIFTLCLTAIPAIILGIVALVKVEKSGGRLTGRAFAILGIVIPVVIAPLFPMAAILLPALDKARVQAKTAICRSNLAQWGLVWRLYTDDNNGFFPADVDWPELLEPYVGTDVSQKLLLCPLAVKCRDEGGRIPFAAWCDDDVRVSYGLNFWVTNHTDVDQKELRFWRTPNVRGAASAPLMLDCSWPDLKPLHSDEPPEYAGQPGSGGVNEMRSCCINRHNGTINAVFLDFSVRKVGLKELWELRWHRDWPADQPPPKWPPWMGYFPEYAKLSYSER